MLFSILQRENFLQVKVFNSKKIDGASRSPNLFRKLFRAPSSPHAFCTFKLLRIDLTSSSVKLTLVEILSEIDPCGRKKLFISIVNTENEIAERSCFVRICPCSNTLVVHSCRKTMRAFNHFEVLVDFVKRPTRKHRTFE